MPPEETRGSPLPRWGFQSLKWLALAVAAFVLCTVVNNQVRLFQTSSAASAVHDLLKRQQDAWNAKDMPGFLSHYQMTDDTTFYADGTIEQGWVMIGDRYTKRPPEKMGRLEFTGLRIDMMSPDRAAVRGRWATDDGREQRSGLFTLLMRRLPEGWKIVHDHTSEAKKN